MFVAVKVSFQATKRSYKTRIRVPSSCEGIRKSIRLRTNSSQLRSLFTLKRNFKIVSIKIRYYSPSCSSLEYPFLFSVSWPHVSHLKKWEHVQRAESFHLSDQCHAQPSACTKWRGFGRESATNLYPRRLRLQPPPAKLHVMGGYERAPEDNIYVWEYCNRYRAGDSVVRKKSSLHVFKISRLACVLFISSYLHNMDCGKMESIHTARG